MNSNQFCAPGRNISVNSTFFSLLTALCVLSLGSCSAEKPSIDSTPTSGEDVGIARVEIPNGTFSFEVVYPDKIAVGELVTLKDSKGYTSNLRSVANQFYEVRAEEPLEKGDLCKIVYYFKGWNNGRSRTCERITAIKVKLEVEKNFGDTPASPVGQTPEPSRTLLMLTGVAGFALRRRRK
jgi:hypothetical protein